ncbi:phage tail tape measure protein [Butyricicoccus intestinisimiae]|uniref:Phage tail tape measure protein n=1 Tax=Butyricicoccus intestinisimiae TaxID=2841509 RepID=A0ABS6EN69_9FIRM|nr:phage tail tape measure protein [Butyricicoccus intestinisimiae]MBU5489137.1 phage tail tape measure protein [Butyricicoccus intestinisimiae]
MASESGSVIIKIEGDDTDFKSKVNGLGKTAESGVSKLGNVVKTAAVGIGGAMVAIGGYAIKVGSDFESAMSNVAAISGATGDDLQMLKDTAQEMGATTQFSATEAANALSYMALAGWDANQSASALPGVLNLAAASGMELASASDMVTDYMSAFGMSCEQSGYFADMLAYAQSNANTTAELLGESYKNCAANMAAAGQDVETTTSLLAMMANQGLKGSEAGTALAAVMRDLTAKMSDGAIKIGDTSVAVQDANGNYRDLTDILQDVESATNGMGDAEKAAALSSTFTADSIKGLNLILNAGVSNAADFENQLRNSGGTAENMANVMNDNLAGAMKSLQSRAETFGNAIYESFSVQLKDAVNTAADALGSLTDAFKTGGIEGAFNQLGILAQQGIQTIIAQAPAMTQAAAQMINNFASGLAEGIPNVLAQALPLILQFTESLRENAGTLIDAGLNLILQLAQGIANSLPLLIEYIPQIVTNIAGIINDNAPKILATGVQILATLALGIIQALPVLIASLPNIILAIVNVFSAFNWISLGQLIVNGVKAGVSLLGTALKSAGTAAANAFRSINWASVGQAAINFIKSAISGAAGLVSSGLRSVGTQAMNAFRSINWASVGRAAINFIKSAITGAASLVASALRAAATAGMNAFKSVNWGSVGKHIISGIVNGIKGAASALFNALAGLAKNALNAAKNALGIKSPSRRFRDMVGKFIPLGIAAGVDKYSNTAANAVSNMSSKLTDAASVSALNNKLKAAVSAQSLNMTAQLSGKSDKPSEPSGQKIIYITYAPEQKFDEPITLSQREAMNRRDARRIERLVKNA